jgi:hypothetical protein
MDFSDFDCKKLPLFPQSACKRSNLSYVTGATKNSIGQLAFDSTLLFGMYGILIFAGGENQEEGFPPLRGEKKEGRSKNSGFFLRKKYRLEGC